MFLDLTEIINQGLSSYSYCCSAEWTTFGKWSECYRAL